MGSKMKVADIPINLEFTSSGAKKVEDEINDLHKKGEETIVTKLEIDDSKAKRQINDVTKDVKKQTEKISQSHKRAVSSSAQMPTKNYDQDIKDYKKYSAKKIQAMKALRDYDMKYVCNSGVPETGNKIKSAYKKYKDTGDKIYLTKAARLYQTLKNLDKYLPSYYKKFDDSRERVLNGDQIKNMRSDMDFVNESNKVSRKRLRQQSYINFFGGKIDDLYDKYDGDAEIFGEDFSNLFEQETEITASFEKNYQKSQERLAKDRERNKRNREKRKRKREKQAREALQNEGKDESSDINDENGSSVTPPSNDESIKKSNSNGENVLSLKRKKYIDKHGEKKTSETRKYADGISVTTENGAFKSDQKEIFNLETAYKSLNKSIEEYYKLKLKQDTGQVKPEDQDKTALKLKQQEENILAQRKLLSDLREQGIKSDDLESNSRDLFEASRSDYQRGIDTYAESNRIAEIQKKQEEESKVRKAQVDAANKAAEEQSKAEVERQNRLMQQENARVKTQQRESERQAREVRKQQKADNKSLTSAADYVSDENIRNRNEMVDGKLSEYSAQENGNSKALDNARKLAETIKTSQSELKKLIDSGASIDSIIAEFEKLTSAVKNFETEMKTVNMSDLSKNLNTADFKTKSKDFLSYINENNIPDDMKETFNDIEAAYSNPNGISIADDKKFTKNFNDAKKQLETIKQARSEASKLDYLVKDEKYTNFNAKYSGQDTAQLTDAKARIAEVRQLQEEISTGVYKSGELAGQNIGTEELVKKVERLKTAYKEADSAMKAVGQSMSKSLDPAVAETSANKVQTYMNNNTKALKKYRTELESLKTSYKNASTEGEKLSIDTQFKNLQSKISSEGLTGKSAFEDAKRAASQIAQFAGIYNIIQNVAMDVPRQIVQAVRDVNAAQIELRKVSDASDSQLNAYWDEASQSAQKYGATISDVISSTADWSKLGYDLDQAKELSDATTLYQKVGDNMTQETASESLVSTLQGFKMDASQAESIVDKLNEVANNFAIGSDGIGEALQRSAASFEASGTSLSKSIALITGTNEVVQDPDKVGEFIADLYRNIMKIKVAISVNIQRWIRPSKDLYNLC